MFAVALILLLGWWFGPEARRFDFQQLYFLALLFPYLISLPFQVINEIRTRKAAKAKAKSLSSLERVSSDLTLL